jgi:hypothetical protein
VGLPGVASHLCRILHLHLTAERIVVDGLLHVVVAVNDLPCAAEVVGDVVVPTGGSTISVKFYIPTVELPDVRYSVTQYQAVNIEVGG